MGRRGRDGFTRWDGLAALDLAGLRLVARFAFAEGEVAAPWSCTSQSFLSTADQARLGRINSSKTAACNGKTIPEVDYGCVFFCIRHAMVISFMQRSLCAAEEEGGRGCRSPPELVAKSQREGWMALVPIWGISGPICSASHCPHVTGALECGLHNGSKSGLVCKSSKTPYSIYTVSSAKLEHEESWLLDSGTRNSRSRPRGQMS
jgi:hypothetical protein